MALFELQEWLGHRTPEATTHYAKLTPNTPARAYNDAGYFARNVRTIGGDAAQRQFASRGQAFTGHGREHQSILTWGKKAAAGG
ncbi:hypothetical protein ACFYTG_20465 [Streptomyces mirabilis]|uniref:hypothetical protein n=1 Tax=Streptomyces mirabilis TaxID=68239 RepID=UPI0036BA3CCD